MYKTLKIVLAVSFCGFFLMCLMCCGLGAIVEVLVPATDNKPPPRTTSPRSTQVIKHENPQKTPQKSTQEKTKTATKWVVKTKSGDPIPAAISYEAHNRFGDLVAAKDYVGIEQMMRLGLVFTIEHGTEVTVIDRGFLTSEIRPKSGLRKDIACWIASDFLKRE